MATTQTERTAVKSNGASWLRRALKVEVGEFGARVAEVLDVVFQGIYHLEDQSLAQIDWTADHITYTETHGMASQLATTDNNRLTALVLAAHQSCIRLDISVTKVPSKTELWDAESRIADLKESIQGRLDLHDDGQQQLVQTLAADKDEPNKVLYWLRKLYREQRMKELGAYAHVWMQVRKAAWSSETPDAQDLHDLLFSHGYDPQEYLIRPAISLLFTPRQREGGISLRHPTIEEAIARLTPALTALPEPPAAAGDWRLIQTQ